MSWLSGLFDSNKTTDASYNKNTNQQFAGQTNQQQAYNPFGAGYTNFALQQGQPGILGTLGTASPYYGAAANLYGLGASTPDVASFYNPFASNVLAGMQDVFGQQMKQTTGNLTQQAGGVGADRIAVGQANLARQQGLAAGQTLAGIYGQAQQAAAQQRAQQIAAGQGFGNLGTAAQYAALAPWMAFGQYTGQLAPQLGGQMTGQSNQAGQMTGTESGTSHQTQTSSPSLWSDFMNLAGFAGGFMNRGGRTNPFARGGSVDDFARFDPRSYARGGHPDLHWPRNSYASGGDVESFDDRWAPTEDAIASGEFDPQFENGSRWADEPVSAFAKVEPRPSDADVPLEGEVLPPEHAPPTAPWKPAPYESEMPGGNPYAMPRQMDRSSLSGFLASRGVIGPDTAETISNFGRRLQRASLAGQGVQGATAAQRLPLEERGLELRAQQQAIEAARQQQALEETMRHNRATEKHAGDVLDVQRQRFGSGLFDPETVNMMAEQALTGDKSVFANLGRGISGPQNIVQVRQRMNELMRQRGYSGSDIAAANANFSAQAKAAGSAAVREANVASAIEEAKNTFPLALKASEALPRTDYVPWNQLVQMVRQKTASPAQARFEVAVQGVITAYSQAMSRTGTNTVHAQQHAELLLNKATSHDAFKAAIEQMELEMEAARGAPEAVQKRILRNISGRQEGAPPPPTPGKGGSGGFTGRTATNPNTGEKLRETTDGNWVQ